MSKVMVTEAYLEDVADAIREKNGSSDTYTPAEMGDAIRDLPSGGSSYELIDSTEVTVSTTSTSATSVLSWRAAGVPTSAYPLLSLIRIRDKAGPREGYFYGSDNFYFSGGAGTATTAAGRILLKYTTDGMWMPYSYTSSTGYGVYVYNFNSGASYTTIRIYSRYSSTYSTTIDGTFTVDWYRLKSPNNVTP